MGKKAGMFGWTMGCYFVRFCMVPRIIMDFAMKSSRRKEQKTVKCNMKQARKAKNNRSKND